MFRAQWLWDLVENKYDEPNSTASQPSEQLRDSHKRDAKTLFLIQSDLDDEIFLRVVALLTFYQA